MKNVSTAICAKFPEKIGRTSSAKKDRYQGKDKFTKSRERTPITAMPKIMDNFEPFCSFQEYDLQKDLSHIAH
ncbi:hypothetical protein BsIDN1_42810 [Bacillus safensis]|uniref:Uncharacterized protein n=1 Tax=Bacillus safensis TaxID=561879 RepID=A0A5S9MC20_BACIA|nr:hypothetical protein BsIDN1_42810 [Bacillus safensis]